MKKVLFILSILLLSATAGFSQSTIESFFSREPKLAYPASSKGVSFYPYSNPVKLSVTTTDSIFNVIRPIVVPAAYSYGPAGSSVSAGAGFMFQHQDYNYATQLYTVKWEAGIVGFGGLNAPPPNSLSAIATVAIMGGAPIQGIPFLVGPSYIINAPKGQHFGAEVSVSINFNN
jgi:hypothetical protein